MTETTSPLWGVFGLGFVPGRYSRDPRALLAIDESSRLPRPRCGTRGALVRRATSLDLANLRRCRNCDKRR